MTPTNPTRVLLVDPRPLALQGLSLIVDAQRPRMETVGQASSYAQALYLTERLRPDVVLLSFFADALVPMRVLFALLRFEGTRVVVLANEDVPEATAIAAGASGIVHAQDSPERIIGAIADAALEGHRPTAYPLQSPAGPIAPTDDEHFRLLSLTPRERELIAALVAQPGAKYFAIAQNLGISEHTVHNHLSSIYQKLDLNSRSALFAYAVRRSLDGPWSPAEARPH